ncbi:MAG: prolyl oligopeptidase family serine peptidase [Verrucomicrobiaceae bacterium]
MNKLFLCLGLVVVSSLQAAPASKITRTWKSADGREMQADLLEFNADEVRLKRTADLQAIKVPLTALGAKDRKYIAGLLHEEALDVSLTKGVYADQITGSFVQMTSKQGLNYQLFGNPKWDSEQRYPLVIWLHGSGQSGSDNTSQMGGATGVFTDPERQLKNPCFMIAPQCPDADIGWNKQVADNLMALVADLTDKLPIDTNRLYLTGSSMGGFGTFNLALKYPTLWAAVVPLCGGSDVKNAEALKAVPIWAFHGDKDDMVPVERTRHVMKAIAELGGIGRYTELTGAGHGITGLVYPNPELQTWMFARKRAVQE